MVFEPFVLPPIAARPFATSMRRFPSFSSLFGPRALVGDAVLSFEGGLALGASFVAAAHLELLPCLLVRFCCKKCIDEFRKNPDKYIAKLDEAASAAKKH